MRWRERAADAHAIEARAALLADAASAVPPLSGPALTRIREEIEARGTRRGWLGGPALPLQARLALVLALLIAGGTTAVGARFFWRGHGTPERRVAPVPAEAAPVKIRHPAARVAARAPDVDAPPPMEAQPLPSASGTHGPRSPKEDGDPPVPTRMRSAAPVAIEVRPHALIEPPPAAVESPAPPAALKTTEAALIAEALTNLRQRSDPRAALATLDRYGRDFQHGVLEVEALRTRVEAVLQLGELTTALALLDAKAGGAGDDLLLTRAELRASAGRFREALADFDQVMERAEGASISSSDERALYGRAVCLARLGQFERARADLVLYQKWFPHGRFAVDVQRLLASPASAARP
jgi:hypothetical protein